MSDPSTLISFEGKITRYESPMKIKASGSGREFTVREDAAIHTRRLVAEYTVESVYNLPFLCKRDGNTVVDTKFEDTKGPLPVTNGHGQTGATSSTSAANSSTSSSNARNGATGT